MAEKIRVTLAEPYLLKRSQEGTEEITVEHHCTSSIGVVLFKSHDASQLDILEVGRHGNVSSKSKRTKYDPILR